MIHPSFHVRFVTSSGVTKLSPSYDTPGDALKAACLMWVEHENWGVCVVSNIGDALSVLLNEDHVKQTANEELPGARCH